MANQSRTYVLWLAIAVCCACKKQPEEAAAKAVPPATSSDAGATIADAVVGAGLAGSAGMGPAAAESAEPKAGDPIYAKWSNGEWYPARIIKINADGTYHVKYSDGDVDAALPKKKLRPRKPSTASSGSSRQASSSGAKCQSPYVDCRGWCVDLSSNSSNCGRCGNSCPLSRNVCRGGSCDCTGYDKDRNGGVCPN